MEKIARLERGIKKYHAQNREAKNARIVFGVLALGALLFFARKPIQKGVEIVVSNIRGVRNKNPLNIRHNPANKWQGMTGVDDKGFVIFSDNLYGLRAGFRLLNGYRAKNLDTIAEIIAKFAPPSENDTAGYIRYVSEKTGLAASKLLSESDLPAVINAMTKMETNQTFDATALMKAQQMARA